MKDIEEYEGKYSITNDGKVWSHLKEIFLKQMTNNSGYKMVWLKGNGKPKGVTVHRLVAKSYVDNPNGLPIVNHKDSNQTNNDYTNLEWCTHAHNNKHAWDSGKQKNTPRKQEVARENGKKSRKLTPDQVREIRYKYRTSKVTYKELCKEYGIKIQTMSNMICGNTYKDII